MKVLVIGGGGREHAVCLALSKSERVTELLCAPGNGGIARVARCIPEVKGSSTNLPTLAASLMQSRNSTTNSFSPDFTVRCKKSSCPSKAATSLSKLFAPPDEPPKIFFKKSIIFDISLVCVFQIKIFTFFVNLLYVTAI